MKNIIKLILLSLIISVNINAQPITWMRYYNPTGSNDEGTDVIENNDNSYVFLASTTNGICLIKTNKFGQIIWQKYLGDTLGNACYCMQKTSDNGFVIAGGSLTIYHSMQLIKTNSEGNIQWVKRYTRTGVQALAYTVKITYDNGFILCGEIYNSIMGFKSYVVKADSLGNMQWDNTYNSHSIYDIIQLMDGNYFSVGYLILRKIDYLGNELWTMPIGQAVKILQSNEGYLYLGGGQGQFYLAKYDTSGNQYFSKQFFNRAYCYGMCFTNDQNIILAGGIGNDTSNVDIVYSKINESGDLVYSKIINLPGNTNELIQNVRSTFDNGLIMCGNTNYPMGGDFDDNILSIKTDSLGNTSPIVDIKNITTKIDEFELFQNYPNPFNPVTTIRYTLNKKNHIRLYVSDITGKIVKLLAYENKPAGKYEYRFDGSNLTSGIYFFTLQTDNNMNTKKMFLIK